MIDTLLATKLPAWIGIGLCITQSAMFAGLNLAIFSVSRLRLEVAAAHHDRDAIRVLDLRKNYNFTLATVLWGNVAVNVLLTLLSDSLFAGAVGFAFSTVVITLFGEVIPQAYFSRHALRMAAMLAPVLRIYQVILFPVTKLTAKLLDWWLGPEAITFFQERDFRILVTKHVAAADGDVGELEGIGALNFLDLDDIPVFREGEPLDPRSIITLPIVNERPLLPRLEHSPDDPFLRRLNASGKKWVVIADASMQPRMVIDAHHFLRDALFDADRFRPDLYWHRPIVVTDPRARLGDVLGRLRVKPEHPGDDVIDNDLILAWGEDKRIITGADLLGRLLRGIVARDPRPPVLGGAGGSGTA